MEEKRVCFWKIGEPNDWLSNWSPHPIRMGDTDFPTMEHFYVYKKAEYFKDNDIMRRVFNSPDPRVAKSLGRRVYRFDAGLWNVVSYAFMVEGLTFKALQHDEVKERLMKIEGEIVEASPLDLIWGAGVAAKNMGSTYPGKNLLGQAWMEVRENLKSME